MAGSPEITESQAARLIVRALGALIAVVLSGGVVAVVQSRVTRQDATSGVDVADVPPSSMVVVAAPIGPLAGVEISTYIPARAAVLAAAEGERAAVVSFAAYTTAADARLRTTGLTVVALLVAVRGASPTAVLIDPPGADVFGAVVRGPAGTLRAVARSQGIRLVDASGVERVPDLAHVAGLRPEERRTAGDPPVRPG